METIQVKVGKVPGRIQELGLSRGTTVGEALRTAELDPSGFEVRCQGEVVGTNHILADGDTLLLVKKITGN